MTKKIKLIFQILILIVLFQCINILTKFIIPQVANMLEEQGLTLTKNIRLLMMLADFFSHNIIYLILILTPISILDYKKIGIIKSYGASTIFFFIIILTGFLILVLFDLLIQSLGGTNFITLIRTIFF